jgi:hypothetical protein
MLVEQLLTPMGEAGPHGVEVVSIGAVERETFIGVALQHGEEVGQDVPVEAGIGLLGKLTQALAGVATRRDRSVDVEEVARLGSGEERGHLAGDDIVGVQTGPMFIWTGGCARQLAASSTL